MPFCPKCGTSVDANVMFCPKCGSPIGMSSTPPPPPSFGSPGTTFSSVDSVGLGKIKMASLLGIVGIALGFIVPFATGFGFTSFLGVGTNLSGVLSSLLLSAIVGIVGFIIGIVSIIMYRSGFKALSSTDNGFSTPSRMVLGLLVALALFVIGFIVIVAGFIGTLGLSYSGTLTSLPAGLVGTLLAAGALFLIGVIAVIVGIIGIILGLWRAGDRYQEGLLKVGGILFIIPYLDILAPILVYIGASNAEKKVRGAPHG
jgi:hypothetical protein